MLTEGPCIEESGQKAPARSEVNRGPVQGEMWIEGPARREAEGPCNDSCGQRAPARRDVDRGPREEGSRGPLQGGRLTEGRARREEHKQ